MIECEITDYQPGTATRYLLVHGIVTDPMDAMTMSCGVGDMFIAWKGHGVYTFNDGVVPEYLAEKFNIKQYMLDAIALVQFIRVKMNRPMLIKWQGTEWKICDQCGLPIYMRQEDSECLCKMRL